MYSVTIIGAGNVASRFAIALNKAGHRIECICNRNLEKAEHLNKVLRRDKCNPAITSDYNAIPQSDIIIIAVSDSAIAEVIASIPKRDSLIVHTSGATAIDIFETKRPGRYGVFYPLMTLSKGKPLDIRIVPFLIEASDQKSLSILISIVESLKAEYKVCDSETRLRLHLGAVYATNFINYMLSLAYDISHPDFVFLLPSAVETVRKAFLQTPDKMQTGPAMRGDLVTIEKHKNMLEEIYPQEHRKVYDLLTELIKKKYEQL